MTTIYCSNKLKDFVGQTNLTTVDSSTENKFGDWNGHLIIYDREKYLMFINNKTYYVVILPRIKKADLSKFDSIFIDRLIEQLTFDSVIERTDALILMQRLLPVRLARTNNDRKAIGTLNEFIYQFKVQHEFFDWRNKSITYINGKLNDTIVSASRPGKRDYGRPIDDMKSLMNTST
ncbi:MAG: hypothetical protein K0Q95_1435 [Bacteroidota bacterium]|jgi:hypothetical protein|nr:hypothetical protein [Bacteroidota bacterium]